MAEPRRSALGWAWLALGAGLSLLPLWAHPAALLGTWLAQPALALGLSAVHGLRADRAGRRDFLALAVLWFVGFAGVALAAGWPLAALRDTGSLAAALALSAMAGAVLLCLWRAWPAFGLGERDGAPLPALAAAVGSAGPPDAARGFLVALAVFAVLAGGLLLAWPDLLPAHLRLPAVAVQLLSALIAHAVVLRFGAAPSAHPLLSLPIHGDDGDTDFTLDPLPADDDDADARLYAAARAGRIDAALAALEAGADPSAAPAAEERDQRNLPMLAALLGDLRLLRELIARGVDLNPSTPA